ncbi:hypothetical protein KC332_g5364 [Hortaea werneckii]|nr:hypothetical protein KC350_g4409 [Hortaea werneckii]KAI6851592.1 hypothetical protein KC358_g104 [Hortaea werneckii]KAI6938102.1 hypothetical protein KC341_g5132 [Hortaea werneckii]KAI6938302.1 hypothetical protein KC348_g5523 [Hortaea werneckii]KAI6966067.1 hypothetical protein KC321_g9765 [Hortaea werneckii]
MKVHQLCGFPEISHPASPMERAINCIILGDGTRINVADLIGNGSDGFIIRKGHHVLKVPKLHGFAHPDGTIEADSDNDFQSGRLEIEKQVYKRLHGSPGIAECVDCTGNGILLMYYPIGAFSEYMARSPLPSKSWRWKWILQATESIAGCHERGVLVFDIALKNFLLAHDFSLRLIDFSNSSLAPMTEEITLSETDGSTAKMALLHLANVIYSIWVWREFTVKCAMESEWPEISLLPGLEGFEIGQLIRKCWERKYTAIQELVFEVRRYAQESSPAGSPEYDTLSLMHEGARDQSV